MSVRIVVESGARGPRLAYVLTVLCERYGWSWGWAAHYDGRGSAPGTARLSYAAPDSSPAADLPAAGPPAAGPPAAGPRGAAVAIVPHGLLTAPSGSTACDLAWGRYGGVACPTGEDPLAGAFYCLALLAEYAPRAADEHGRLPAATHPFFLRGLHRVPVADRLLGALAGRLHAAAGHSGAPATLAEASAAGSDVDAPRALAGKPPLRRLGALARGILSTFRSPGPITAPAQLAQALRARWDPFDNFAYMHAEARARDLHEDFFTLVGYGTRLDPGYRYGDAAWVAFWRKLPPGARLGIHPSYHAAERPELLRAEVRHLRDATDAPVTASRQHFLRLRIPETFRVLEACGIREDHTLMWADADGFRAGTARSFPWYDLQRERTTGLRLFPPHAMDVTARYYGGLTPKQAIASWRQLATEARASGTALRCIWHNSNLGPWYGWWPWRVAYEASLDLSVIPDRPQLRPGDNDHGG